MNLWLAVETMRKGFQDRCTDIPTMAPNNTAYTQWSCHSGLANPVQIVSTPPAPSNGCPITFWASRPCRPTRWLAMLLIKAGCYISSIYIPEAHTIMSFAYDFSVGSGFGCTNPESRIHSNGHPNSSSISETLQYLYTYFLKTMQLDTEPSHSTLSLLYF